MTKPDFNAIASPCPFCQVRPDDTRGYVTFSPHDRGCSEHSPFDGAMRHKWESWIAKIRAARIEGMEAACREVCEHCATGREFVGGGCNATKIRALLDAEGGK